MSLRLALLVTIVVVLFLALAQNSEAQSISQPSPMPMLDAPRSPWSGDVKYGISSDLASDKSPKSYEHVLLGDVGYQINSRWSLGATLSVRAETINGQIPKEREQSYDETLGAGTSFEAVYSRIFKETHSYSLYLEGEPLWTEDSRREGHKGLVGAGGALALGFFAKRYTMTNMVSATSLINTYATNTNMVANPDYFYTYKFINSIRFARTYKISYTFGMKVTRYLDDFIGYSYSNSVSLSKTWQHLSATLSYDNGGFTDDGYIRLWYIDDYRRIFRLMLSYSF